MSNPLAGLGGKPIVGIEGPNKTFVGRIIIDLLEGPQITSDAKGMVLIVSPGLGNNVTREELLQRVAATLLVRAKGAVKVDDLDMTNPLVSWEGKPIVGVEDPNNKFLGRVLSELYEGPQITSDKDGMVLVVSPSLGNKITKVELLQRIASAFPTRVVDEIKREERKRKIAEERGGVY